LNRTILIVEDEKAISDILEFNLKREGYEVCACGNGLDGLEAATSRAFDLILLDVMLPGMDGFKILQEVRKTSSVPVIMLTAREEETDKVTGLELGADDYVTKPFSMRELIARVKANIRRTAMPAGERGGQETVEWAKGLTYAPAACEIYKNGKNVELSSRDFEILTLLASAPDKVFSREELMKEVWGYAYYGDLRAVDVAIRRLREKIEDDPAEPAYIMTKRGFGYYFKK
jgi:two-component system response regulator VicR